MKIKSKNGIRSKRKRKIRTWDRSSARSYPSIRSREGYNHPIIDQCATPSLDYENVRLVQSRIELLFD
jgi:hypothetical protein